MIVQTTLSDRIISQNIGTSAELKEALNNIDKLNQEIEGLNSEIDQLEDTIEDKDDLIANIIATHQEEINSINQEHQADIEQLNKDHLAEIDAINQGYTDRDNELMVIINDIQNLL